MPFEPAPKTEQQDRVQLGRIALEAIAAHILTVPEEYVNMSAWCGTACCAIGHGVKLPEVRALGLYMFTGPDGYAQPAFGELRAHEAIGEALGIGEQLSFDLFYGTSGVGDTAPRVASLIRQYLARTAMKRPK